MSQALRSASAPPVGGLPPPRALELERRRDDPDRQRAELPGDPRDDGCRTGARTAALAGGDEDHVGAAQRRADLVVRVLGRQPARFRVGARTEAVGDLLADVDLRARSQSPSCWLSVLTAT